MVRALYEFQPLPLLGRLPVPVLIAMASDASDGVAPAAIGWWRSRAEAAAGSCRNGRFRLYASRHDIPLIRPAELAADIVSVAVGDPSLY
jgi:hypothetical protein